VERTVIPVVTPEEMGRVDRQAPDPVEVLVDRAGAAVAREARRMLGGCYGRRVIVVAGKGNNGADGRAAARRLAAAGARVGVLDVSKLAPGAPLPAADLIIDAAYGTGLGRPFQPPDAGSTPVLAVDIPSGVSGLTGEIAEGGDALGAEVTVTFAAYKPGLLLGAGAQKAGRVRLADIGLEAGVEAEARTWLIEDADVDARLPRRPREAHKWQTALAVVAGSPGMIGAPWLVSHTALRGGAGYVRLGIPGVDPVTLPPGELVSAPLPTTGWDVAVLDGLERFKALVMGPGLGPVVAAGGSEVARVLEGAPVPVVLDADGINAIGSLARLSEVAARRSEAMVITPHEGEFTRLTGAPPGADRIESVRHAAARSGVIVLLKGSTTVVAHPDGRVLLTSSGSSRLATAGSGDALSGLVGAFLARGMEVFEAAALAAHVHGRAAGRGRAEGLVASDLADLISDWLSGSRP
jgi:hydroxyethylthiazole kinase-like uncharacterized protein yjeF